MVEEDEPIPILKPLRIAELFLCICSLAFFTVYIAMADIRLTHHLSGLIYATFIAFFIICLVDVISQIAGEPITSTPMFLFSLFAVCMFLASGVVAINFYSQQEKYSWALLACAVSSLVTTVLFAADAALLCRDVSRSIYYDRRPLLEWPKCRRRPSQEPERGQPSSGRRVRYVQMQQEHQHPKSRDRFQMCPKKKDEMIQTSGGDVQQSRDDAQIHPRPKGRVQPKRAFHKQKDEMIQTSGSDMAEQLLFETSLDGSPSMYTPAQQSMDDYGGDDGVLVDDKRVHYRQVSRGQLLQIVNCVNVRRVIGNPPEAEYGSDTSAPEATPAIEESITQGDSIDMVQTSSKDESTQFPSKHSKRCKCCCRGDSTSASLTGSQDNSMGPKLSATLLSNSRRNSPANGSRNQEVQVDPYQLGMRVVPVQRRSEARKRTPIAVAAMCEVDLIDLPGSVPETHSK